MAALLGPKAVEKNDWHIVRFALMLDMVVHMDEQVWLGRWQSISAHENKLELAVDDANYTPFVYRAEPGPEPETSYPSPALVADWCSGVPDRLKTNEPFTPYFTIEEQRGEGGELFFGYYISGMMGTWTEILRDDIAALQRYCTEEALAGTLTLAEMAKGQPLPSGKWVTLNFCVGYVDPENPPQPGVPPATITSRWQPQPWVESEEPEPVVYECPYCEKEFDSLRELQQHVASDHPDKPQLPPQDGEAQAIPWGLVAAGAGGLALVAAAFYFGRKGE